MVDHIDRKLVVDHIHPEEVASHIHPEEVASHMHPEEVVSHMRPEEVTNHKEEVSHKAVTVDIPSTAHMLAVRMAASRIAPFTHKQVTGFPYNRLDHLSTQQQLAPQQPTLHNYLSCHYHRRLPLLLQFRSLIRLMIFAKKQYSNKCKCSRKRTSRL